ncbi:MAG: outer membrane lipoprotein LolB [Legionellales bacterium]|nr:outer membrane lipoprotein LolB [Legionellales bacterium]|tara:strand:- start:252 stop:878 length:627 start_codon:yes stop_codon:yes gene_type:complete
MLKNKWTFYHIYKIVAPLLALLLTACATMPASKSANNQTITWTKRESQLLTLTHWQANGAMSIKQNNKATSASLYWTQQGQNNYTINLQGPLGTGAMKITAQPGKVTLLQADKQPQSASTAEALLKAQTGWYLPISNLYYWVRGLPVPNVPANKKYDQYHHLQSLQQQGWLINYQRYTAVNNLDLPSKLILQKKPFTIKIIISQWKPK